MKCALFPLALLALTSPAAHAGGSTWVTATVTSITVVPSSVPKNNGYAIVTFATNGAGTPSCATGYPRNIVIDLNSSAGAMAAEMVQRAALGIETLTVTGTGTCTLLPNTETLASLQAQLGGGPSVHTFSGPTPTK